MRYIRPPLLLVACLLAAINTSARPITVAGEPGQLNVRVAGEQSVRVTLKPVGFEADVPTSPILATRDYPAPAMSLREVTEPMRAKVGNLSVEIRSEPLTVLVSGADGKTVQELTFADDGTVSFRLGDAPVLGMGGGGPRPVQGQRWREQPIQFDRRGRLDTMEPRWQADAYGSRNPVAMLVGTEGWGLYVASPWVEVHLSGKDRGRFVPRKPAEGENVPQNQRNQQQTRGKGLPPPSAFVPGLFDLFVFDAREPARLMKDFAAVTGPAVLPPKWALGYMQSHRTLQDEKQLLEIIDTFRAKQIPLDAVIYLGTGFCPRGWNTRQPSFTFNPDVFQRDPAAVIADMHARHVKVAVHIVPFDRDKLPTLHGSIPPAPGEQLDAGHIHNYWQQHLGLVQAGIDAFWPDEGDWFDLHERITRHQMYYQGPLSARPDVRPWSLHRNGHAGIAQWGGWVWSGDTESAWKTLEGQIAVGVNASLSLTPYWGSDIGGFYPNAELTGELYARWFQFGAFCGSFRSHGRTWWTRLPWGWGLSEMGPRETNNTNADAAADARRHIQASELNNPAIEPIAKKYAELRYRLMPYTYTLAWEARESGMPLMRAMWLHHPADERARSLGDQYLWGRDLLIAPIYQKGAASREVYLPRGDWYDWWTNARTTGGRTVTREVDLATMPIYVRAGAIIPIDPVRQYTAQVVNEPTTLQIYRGADGDFTLYEDDGISQAYLKGEGAWTRLRWDDLAGRLTVEPAPPKGATNVAAPPRTFKVVLLPEGKTSSVEYAGKAVTTTF